MAQCLLLLLSRCCYFPRFCSCPAPAFASASAYFLLYVLLLLLEPATETNTHIYQISMPQGLQNELHLAVALATPLATSPLLPLPPSLYCSCPKCLAALYSSSKSRGRRRRWRKLRRRNQLRPQCKAADKVCNPPPFPAAVTVQELGEKRRLAG